MTEPPARVHELAARRADAREARDFAAADALRAQITELGWVVTDGAAGYVLAPSAVDPANRVYADPAAIPPAPRRDPERLATVALLVQGWPGDLRECVAALLSYAPAGVVISALDAGNVGGSGDALHELAVAHPGRIEEFHVAAGGGWGASRNALLRADPGPVHVIMETSTILTGDAISPLLAALAADGVVAAGWRGVDPDPDLRGFHDAGPGTVTALLGQGPVLPERRPGVLAAARPLGSAGSARGVATSAAVPPSRLSRQRSGVPRPRVEAELPAGS